MPFNDVYFIYADDCFVGEPDEVLYESVVSIYLEAVLLRLKVKSFLSSPKILINLGQFLLNEIICFHATLIKL